MSKNTSILEDVLECKRLSDAILSDDRYDRLEAQREIDEAREAEEIKSNIICYGLDQLSEQELEIVDSIDPLLICKCVLRHYEDEAEIGRLVKKHFDEQMLQR